MEGNNGTFPGRASYQPSYKYHQSCATNRPARSAYRKDVVSSAIPTKQQELGQGSEKNDPFSPKSLIPLPPRFGPTVSPDSPCFRRRNERERERVRCVNEGYIRLKQHLPVVNKDKRLSKVDTLRYAIQYIKDLQRLLDQDQQNNIGCHDSSVNNVSNAKENYEYTLNTEYVCSSANDKKQPSPDQQLSWGSAIYTDYKSDPESDYEVLSYSSDLTDMSSDVENFH